MSNKEKMIETIEIQPLERMKNEENNQNTDQKSEKGHQMSKKLIKE